MDIEEESPERFLNLMQTKHGNLIPQDNYLVKIYTSSQDTLAFQIYSIRVTSLHDLALHFQHLKSTFFILLTNAHFK